MKSLFEELRITFLYDAVGMRSTAIRLVNKHPFSLLVFLAFVLYGAKTPFRFLVWSVAVLLFAYQGVRLQFQSPKSSSALKAIALLAALIVSWIRSYDPWTSLFPTSQWLVYLTLWYWTKTDIRRLEEDDWFYPTLGVLAALTLVKTFVQMSQGLWGWGHSHGFLPSNPGINAIWMACLACVFMGRRRDRWELPLGICLMGTVFIGPSRGALLALTAGLSYIVWPWVTWRRVKLGLAFLTVLVALLPTSTVYRRLRLDEGNHRLQIWKIAGLAALERPLTGYGLGNFELAYQKYAFPVESDSIRYGRTTDLAHNEYLQVASDLGLPAFYILLTGLFGMLLSSKVRPQSATKAESAGLYTLLIAALYIPVWHIPLLVCLTIVLSCRVFYASDSTRSDDCSFQNSSRHRPGVELILWLVLLPLVWSAVRDIRESQGRWDLIVRWNPRDAWAWKSLGDLDTDFCGKGLSGYSEAARRNPNQVYILEAYARRLEACRAHDSLEILKELYRRAYALAPNRAVNALSLGRIAFLQGNYSEALSWVQSARRIEPHYWECDLWMARCYYQQGDLSRARFILRHLRARRTAHLRYQQLIRADLPWPDDPSSYSNTILGYDDKVLREELLRWQQGHSLLPERNKKVH